MGGYSSEFEISIQSGTIVCQHLDPTLYEVYPVHILKEGWFFLQSDGTKYPINKADFSFQSDQRAVKPDVIFNTIHGTPGEDGILAAYWELLGLKQTSAGFYPAGLSFNKRDCLSVLQQFGIKCANSYYVNQDSPYDLETIVRKVGLPCFVKPNRAGSSFGISKVNTMEDLQGAIDMAFKEDSEILIETALVGTEVSAGVYAKDNEVIALPLTEIVSENDFFDYEAKYLGKSDEITPARIPDEQRDLVQAEVRKIYTILNLSGVARAEFILQEGLPYFLEINTTPGLSAESIIPKQVRSQGDTLTQFFGALIQQALAEK